jgi:hypothetical protein
MRQVLGDQYEKNKSSCQFFSFVFTFPDHMTMHMISDGPNSCKIKGYGKG